MSVATAVAFAEARSVRCPECDHPPTHVFRTREEIAAQLAMRDAFFAHRLLARTELRDVTDVLLGTPAGILRCAACGILVRDDAPDDDAFRDDRYEAHVLASLHEAHAAAFREKERDYRSLLRAGACVVEVGSYVGGFLAVIREWGWDGVGVDIGRDASRFARGLGLDVRSQAFEKCGFARESFDAVFIWNCFEQLAAPRATLAEAYRVLRPFGVLVVRVPDAEFYASCRSVASLAYNGLLGWPHRHGFDAAALRRLVAEQGFAVQRVVRAPAIRPLRNALQTWARREEAAAALGWIEIVFQRQPKNEKGRIAPALR
jgi:SAM-dependent methyltransferase